MLCVSVSTAMGELGLQNDELNFFEDLTNVRKCFVKDASFNRRYKREQAACVGIMTDS